MMVFPGPFQVHAWKKQNKTKHVLGISCQTQTSQSMRKRKEHEEKHVKIKGFFATWNVKFFWELPSDVMEENQSPAQKTCHDTAYKHAEKQQMG